MKYTEQSLKTGIKVEMEHTKDEAKAKKIALDHLAEDQDYYKDWDNKEKILFQPKAPKMKKSEEALEKKQGVPKGVDPAKHERCVKEVKKQGKDKSSAYAICNASMKKGGVGSGKRGHTTSKLDEKTQSYVDKYLMKLGVNGLSAIDTKEWFEGVGLSDDQVRQAMKRVLKKSQENNMAKSIEQEIESMAKSMEESTMDPKEQTINLIKSLGSDGIKRVLPTLSTEQKVMLKSVLAEMNKGMDFDQVTPDKEMTKLANSGAELENGSDDEDEKIAQAAETTVNHQGDNTPEGIEGQVIKSENKESDMEKSIDIDSIVDETLEKSYGMEKMCKADDEKKEEKEGKKILDAVDEVAENEAKEEVKDHEKKMHGKKMKKSKEELIEMKNQIVKSYQDAGLSYNDEIIKSEMKKKFLDEESQVEMGGQDKGGKADKADKKAPKDIKVGEDAEETADEAVAKVPAMKKSLEFEKDENSLLKACTNGRNYHFSVNSYYDEALRKSTEEAKEGEDLKKSESETPSINDLIEKSMDMDVDSVMTDHLLAQHKTNGNYSESFSSVDLLDAMGLSEDEAKSILGE